ncbi:ddaF [Symbiodinium necroappetens]|uniref:DdaF protein n=1 Tax=Symbiodinium necroappetens TaxID=1628268 RepID=A0A812ZZK3_9DINO|nr:ddaF [Symbiodinium necroappetens]
MGHQHNARVMYAFSFILQLVHSLAQSQYLDEYIFKVAERISSQPNFAVGALESIAGIAKLLVALPIGCLVDSRPDRRTRLAWVAVALGCPVVGLAVVAILAERLWMLAVMQVAFVIFVEFASCLAMAIFANSLSAASSNLRTAAFANVQIFQNLGTAVGSGAFSLFLLFQGPETQTDMWTGFQAKSALLTGFGLLFPVMLSLLAFRRAPQSKDSGHTEMKGERVMQRAWVPYLVLLALLFVALATGMIFKFFPLFFINIHNMSGVQIGIIQTLDPLLKACFTYAVGACAQHVGRAQTASFCIAGIIGCLLGMSYLCSGSGTHVWSLVALFMFRGSLGHASFPLIWSILMEHAPASQLGRWSSASAVLNVSWSGSAAISGALLDQHGYAFTFQVAAVLFGVALGVFSPLLFVQKSMESQSPAVEDEEEGEGFSARQVVVVVDPFSTGGNLAAELLSQGYAVVALWTKESNVRYHDYPECLDPKKLLSELDEQPTVEGTAQRLCETLVGRDCLAAVICGGDSGVNVTDALSEALNLRGNGTLSSGHRRDKWVQQEALKAAGVRFARTVCGTTWKQVSMFAETEQYPLVVKPIESAGADGFKLCHSLEEARAHFEFLNTSQRWCGGQGGGVVLQEFLQGPEYVVDQVSCDAVHKTTMVWMYDFQEVNGSRVCVAQRPVSSETMVARELIAYACSCLDALSIRNGASHTELIWTSLGPRLVEVNCRCQGGTGFWLPLCRKMTGYSQMDAVIDAYLNQEAFHALPNAPTFLMSGDIIHLISYEEHLITAMPGLEAVRSLSSFTDLVMNVKIGDMTPKTTDWYTFTGVVALCHADPAALAADISCIRSMELSRSFFGEDLCRSTYYRMLRDS